MKRVVQIMLVATVVFFITSCELGMGIKKIELGKFPDNIVYYVDESDSVDLSGGTLLLHTGSGVYEHSIPDAYQVSISDDIDFSAPGVYEVHITWLDNLVARIPIQVIERE